jgi:mannose-1-phosphate guanylyltransferase
VEPAGRNTAPAIALGAEVLRHRAGEALLVVLPADHLVQDVAGFQDTLTRALRVAEESRSLVTIGITPTRPETGYGYIQYDDGDPANPFRAIGAHPVKTFAEKPSQALARSFIKSGDFLWNAGMFIFRVTALLNAVAEQLPDMADEFHRLRPFIDEPGFGKALDQAYRRMHAISIDYGIMEKADNRYILPADFGWNDLGSWDEVFTIADKDDEGNATRGTVVLTNTERCHVSASDGQVVAAVGMKDAIIIATPDAVLVCHTGDSQAVKEVVDHLRKQGMDSFL